MESKSQKYIDGISESCPLEPLGQLQPSSSILTQDLWFTRPMLRPLSYDDTQAFQSIKTISQRI